jgi:hypothetical protein
MQNKIIKSINFLLFCLIGFSSTDVYAGVKKKIGIETFQNPPNWSDSFNPGDVITGLIIKSLNRSEFRLVPAASWLPMVVKDELKEISNVDQDIKKVCLLKIIDSTDCKIVPKADSMDKGDEKPEIKVARHPAQMVIQGRVMNLSKKYLPGATKGALSVEQIELEVVMQLYNPRTDRMIGERMFKTVANREQTAVGENFDVNSPMFRLSSTGEAIYQITNVIMGYINQETIKYPFDADVVWVNEDKDKVLINAGANDGIQPFELLSVYRQQNHYQDPNTKMDLGDRFRQIGVIKIESVQDDISVGRVMAGDGIEPKNVVRARQGNRPLAW